MVINLEEFQDFIKHFTEKIIIQSDIEKNNKAFKSNLKALFILKMRI